MKHDVTKNGPYQVVIHANWGMSRPDVVVCGSYGVALYEFDDTSLGGPGGIQAVELKAPNGRTLKRKFLEDGQ